MSIQDALNRLKRMTTYEVHVFESNYKSQQTEPKHATTASIMVSLAGENPSPASNFSVEAPQNLSAQGIDPSPKTANAAQNPRIDRDGDISMESTIRRPNF